MKSKFIIFLGVDGAGKSTLTTVTHQMLKENSFRKVKQIWFRSQIQIYLSNLLHNFLKRNEGGDKKEKKSSMFSKLSRELYMFLVLLDYFRIGVLYIRIPILFGYTIISDRYVYDIILDLSACYNYSEERIRKLINYKLFPNPDIIYYINVPVKVVQTRRPEHSIQELNTKIKYFEYFNLYYRHSNDIIILDGTKKVEELSNIIHNSLIKSKETLI